MLNRWPRLAVDPEMDIGTDPRHTPGWLRDLVADAVEAAGLGHDENSPFAGTFVPTHHLGDPRVSSVMLEVRRDTYLDEGTARVHDGVAGPRTRATASDRYPIGVRS